MNIQLKTEIRYDAEAEVFVSCCPGLNIYSQGTDEAEALEALESAVSMHIRYREERHDRLAGCRNSPTSPGA